MINSGLTLRELILGLAVGVLLGILARALTFSSASGSHLKVPPSHLDTINDYEAEVFCVEVADGSMPFDYANGRIHSTLYLAQPDKHWDGLGDMGNLRVSFSGFTVPCRSAVAFKPLRYTVQEDVTAECNAPRSGCAIPIGQPHYDPASGHDEFNRYHVWLDTDWVYDSDYYRFIINHETGHVLGLCDGGPSAESTEYCSGPAHDDCGGVMHYDGCSPSSWPTLEDRESVHSHIPSGGGGIAGGRGCPFALPC